MEVKNPVMLIVLDGWGVAPASRGNAISLAKTSNFNNLVEKYPALTLQASGEAVGLPYGRMGNSEVGHTNLGSGQVVYQDLPFINKEISSGSFFKNKALLRVINQIKTKNSQLHLVGLVSNGGIHSSIDHLFALMELCKQQKVKNVVIHVILDGRDTPRNSGLNFVSKLEEKIKEIKIGEIATVGGRFWAMDRNNNWDRTQKAYLAMIDGKSDTREKSATAAVESYYDQNIFDEEIPPTVITNPDGEPISLMKEGDGIVFFNFRPDRPRQLTKAFILPGFLKFERPREIIGLTMVSFTEYEKDLPVLVAFRPEEAKQPVAKIISENGLKQFHIAETEKYAHVTFFFNGGAENPFEGEERAIIPSPQIASYDKKPAMAAKEIKERVVKELTLKKHNFIIVNFANPDMVGHTGNIAAAIEALEVVDKYLMEIAQTLLAVGGSAIITADHGNCEEMLDLQTGEMVKEHSINPVPCILVNKGLVEQKNLYPEVLNGDLSKVTPSGILSDVATTILELLGLEIPKEWTSRSLIKK